MEDMADIFSKVDKGGEGVCVQVRGWGTIRQGMFFFMGRVSDPSHSLYPASLSPPF